MDNDRLVRAIKESGLKRQWIAEKMNISYNSLRRKLNGEIKWKDYELMQIKELLKEYL